MTDFPTLSHTLPPPAPAIQELYILATRAYGC